MEKNSKGAVSAVIGVILMVALTVAIAATVYVYVSALIEQRHTESIEQEFFENVDISIVNYTANDVLYEHLFNYSFEENNALLVTFNVTNRGDTVTGQFIVNSFNMTFENGTVIEKSAYGVDIEKIILWQDTTGEHRDVLFDYVIGDYIYKVDISFVCEKGILDLEPLYNVTRV